MFEKLKEFWNEDEETSTEEWIVFVIYTAFIFACGVGTGYLIF